CALQQLLIEWLRENDPSEAEAVARRLIEVDPALAWAHRERALLLLRLGRVGGAFVAFQPAPRLEPEVSYTHSGLGSLLIRHGTLADARASFQRAVQLSVDNTAAISGLLAACESIAERREALSFILDELRTQTTCGDGILCFGTVARSVLQPEDLLSTLRE